MKSKEILKKLSYEERLEVVYEVLTNLLAVDIDLQVIAEKNPQFKGIMEKLHKDIERIRDLFLQEEGIEVKPEDLFVEVIDDNPNIRNTVRAELERRGFTVQTLLDYDDQLIKTETIEDAIGVLADTPPDVAVLDVYLKDGITTEVIKHLNYPPVNRIRYVVHSTAWNDEVIRRKYLELGVTEGASKFNFDALAEAILKAGAKSSRSRKQLLTQSEKE